jgi:hypothetical protein
MLLTKTRISYLHLDKFKRDLFFEYESGVENSPVFQIPQVDGSNSFLDAFDDQIL